MRTKQKRDTVIVILERGMFNPQIDPEFIMDADEIPGTIECRYMPSDKKNAVNKRQSRQTSVRGRNNL